jgi:hypothetical protein
MAKQVARAQHSPGQQQSKERGRQGAAPAPLGAPLHSCWPGPAAQRAQQNSHRSRHAPVARQPQDRHTGAALQQPREHAAGRPRRHALRQCHVSKLGGVAHRGARAREQGGRRLPARRHHARMPARPHPWVCVCASLTAKAACVPPGSVADIVPSVSCSVSQNPLDMGRGSYSLASLAPRTPPPPPGRAPPPPPWRLPLPSLHSPPHHPLALHSTPSPTQ